VLRGALAVTFLFGALRGPGCGDLDSPSAGANAPCTRDRDCHAQLACVRGVCADKSPADAGAEAATADAATADAATPDAATADAATGDAATADAATD
jgi:hypothetical protein